MKKDPLDLKLTISKKQFILKIVLDHKMRYIALIIILMLTAGIAGYAVGNLKPISKGSLAQLAQNPITKTEDKVSPLFESQSATVIGTITAINENVLSVTDQKKQTDQFTASDRMLIFKLSLKGPSSSPSADIKTIELNKPVILTLEKNGDKYEVVSIRYMPDLKNIPTP